MIIIVLGFLDYFNNFDYFSIMSILNHCYCTYKLLKIILSIINEKLLNLRSSDTMLLLL